MAGMSWGHCTRQATAGGFLPNRAQSECQPETTISDGARGMWAFGADDSIPGSVRPYFFAGFGEITISIRLVARPPLGRNGPNASRPKRLVSSFPRSLRYRTTATARTAENSQLVTRSASGVGA